MDARTGPWHPWRRLEISFLALVMGWRILSWAPPHIKYTIGDAIDYINIDDLIDIDMRYSLIYIVIFIEIHML